MMRAQPMLKKIDLNLISVYIIAILGFSIPLSTFLDDVLIIFIIVLWFLNYRNFPKFYSKFKENPIAVWCLVISFFYVFGSIYSSSSPSDIFAFLKKAYIYLFIPILISIIWNSDKPIQFYLQGFIAAMVITLALSYSLGTGLINLSFLKGNADNPIVFKNHITHNFLMAFGAFLFAILTVQSKGRARTAYFILALLALYNVFFMIHGRTGYVVLFALILYFLYHLKGFKGLAAGCIICFILGISLYSISSSAFHNRISEGLQEFKEYSPEDRNDTSVGLRLEFYKHSWEIVKENPFFGVGTGGFKKAYADKIKGTQLVHTGNPHNEYLMVATQLGIIGLVIWLILFVKQWNYAKLLKTPFETALARGLVLTILSASLVTSTLIDHTEKLFFAWMSGILYANLSLQGKNASKADEEILATHSTEEELKCGSPSQ